MRILHVIDGLGRGGAERMLVDIANLTAEDGHHVSVCVTGNETALTEALEPRIRVEVLHRRRRITPIAFARLARLAREADVVHAHMRSNAAAVAMLRALRLVNTPLVFHDHYKRPLPRWWRLALPFASHYVGVYERLAEWVVAGGMPAERVTTIPNALDLRRLRAAKPYDLRIDLGIEPHAPLAVFVASLRPDKGVEVLLEAVARASRRMHVVVVGGDGEPAYARGMRALATRLGLDGCVRFVGPRDDVPSLLLSADAGLLSSHRESGPLVLLEYMCAGLPVVATRVGEIGEYVAGQGIPGFVMPGDPAAFAHELDVLASLSPTERRERGKRSRDVVDARWDLAKVMDRWYEVYTIASQANM